MSDSVQPHRRQPTKLPRPWDSPGKNNGVGYHFLLQRMKVKSESEVAQSCLTLSDPMDCSPTGSSIHRIFQARVLEWGAIAFSAQSPSSHQNKELEAECLSLHFYHRYLMAIDFASLNRNGKCHKINYCKHLCSETVFFYIILTKHVAL